MNTPLIASMHLSLPLLLLLGKATIILLAALAITRTMQRASAGARHLVWLVTLATLLLVPAMTAWGPVRVGILPSVERGTRNEEAGTRNVEERGARNEEERGAIAAPVATSMLAATPSIVSSLLVPRSFSFLQALLALWATVAVAILASLAWSGLAVRRIVRQASPLTHESWRTPLYEVADRMGLADAPRLLRSDDAKMPFACGIVTPTIVLPADCDGWSLARRRAVLLHELAHVRRHDLLGHTLGRLACAAYWFHPLVWTAAKGLRNESERACDDLALSCGTRATDYAEHLLEIVTSVRKDATPSVALAMARRKEFEGRMLAILDPDLRRSSPTRRQSAALIGSLALVALTVGAISPVARTANAAQATPRAVAASRPASAPVATHDAAITKYDANSRLAGPTRTAFHADTGVSVNVDVNVDARADARASARMSASLGDAVSTIVSTTTSATANAVREALRDSFKSVQGRQANDERARLLAKVLATDTSAALRKVAAWGLHEYAGEPMATDALAAALRRDASPVVREMAAWALGDGDEGNTTGIDALSAAVRSDADDKVRATAAWALGEVGDRSAVPALVVALAQPAAAVRTRALWAIGSLEPSTAPPAVIALLRDDDAGVRRLAAWALFQIEDPATAGPLSAALKTEQNADVQLAEIRAIGALGEKSVDALKALVESSDPRMRSMAIHALAGRQASGPWPWPWPQPRPYP